MGAAGIGTYCLRLTFMAFIHPSTLPRGAHDALRFVTPAVLAAIIVPAVVYTGGSGHFDASPGNERVVAALAASAVAWATKSVWATIGAGMVVLWLTQWIL